MTAVENKFPSISGSVKKTNYDTNIGEIENKMINLNKKLLSSKTKDISIVNDLKKLKTFDLSYFRGKNHFDEDGNQNYYIFQPISKYLKVTHVNDITYVLCNINEFLLPYDSFLEANIVININIFNIIYLFVFAELVFLDFFVVETYVLSSHSYIV